MVKPINVVIKGDYTDKDINRAIHDLNRLKTEGATTRSGMAAMAGTMRNVVGPAMFAAAGAAGAAAIAFGVDAVKAFIDDDAAAQKLAKTLKNLGLGSATDEVYRFVDAEQLATGVADDQLRPAMDRLLRSTKDVGDAQRLLTLALDISAGTGKTLQQVVESLSRAHDGNTTSLKRLGTGIDEATLKSKDFDRIVGALSSTFDGQASVAAQSLKGKLDRLSVAFSELKESFGRGFITGLSDVTNGFDDLQARINGMQPTIQDLGTWFANELTGVFDLIRQIMGAFNQLNLGLSWIKRGQLTLGLKIIFDDTSNYMPGAPGANNPNYIPGGRYRPPTSQHWSGQQSTPTPDTFALTEDARRNAIPRTSGKGNGGGGGGTVGGGGGGGGGLTAAQQAAQQRASELQRNIDTLGTSLRGLVTDVSPTISTAANATFDSINAQLDKFKSTLADAKQYAQGIVSSFMSQLDIGAALDQAKATGTSIVEAFTKQGEKVVEFGNKMRKLLDHGLSRSAFDEIIGLGYERGGDVADALIQGNIDENIASVNKVYDSVKTMGEQIAEAAADAFYQAGLEATLALVRAMVEGLGIGGKQRKKLLELMDSLADSLNRTATIYVGVSGPGASGGGAVAAASAGLNDWFSATYPGVQSSGTTGSYTGPSFSGDAFAGLNIGSMLGMFADGGVATSPTLGIFGEAGPEALIPLDRMGDFGGNTYSITVNAGVGDPRAIGKSVVEAITLFERSSGPVFQRA